MGADFNSKLRPLAGLVGRGFMRSNQGCDVELEAILQTRNLVLTNTWSSSAATRAHTFRNGEVRSQLDFLVTRRLTVGAMAKMSAPILLDLVPWRKGPKHRPVQGSVRWIAGWCCAKKKVSLLFQYSKQDLREHLLHNTDKAQLLKTRVLKALQSCPASADLQMLNREVLKACQELFPLGDSSSSNHVNCRRLCRPYMVCGKHIRTCKSHVREGNSVEPLLQLPESLHFSEHVGSSDIRIGRLGSYGS